MSLRSACPHLDVVQSYQSLEVHWTLVTWEFLVPKLANKGCESYNGA